MDSRDWSSAVCSSDLWTLLRLLVWPLVCCCIAHSAHQTYDATFARDNGINVLKFIFFAYLYANYRETWTAKNNINATANLKSDEDAHSATAVRSVKQSSRRSNTHCTLLNLLTLSSNHKFTHITYILMCLSSVHSSTISLKLYLHSLLILSAPLTIYST